MLEEQGSKMKYKVSYLGKTSFTEFDRLKSINVEAYTKEEAKVIAYMKLNHLLDIEILNASRIKLSDKVTVV